MSAKRNQCDGYVDYSVVWTSEDQVRKEILGMEQRERREAMEAGEPYVPSYEWEQLYHEHFLF